MALALKERLARQASGETQLTFDPMDCDEPRLLVVPLHLIDPDPDQPRKDQGDLADLALSIREHGVLCPIIVEAAAQKGRYRLLAGERRFRACQGLGLEAMPCIVRTVAQQARLALQLIENLHRKDLHPVEEARAFKRLLDEFNLSQRDLARRVGKSLASVNQTLRILDLKSDLLANVQTSEHATKSVLLEIAKESNPARQEALWQQAQAGELTVRQARTGKRKASPVKPRGARTTLDTDEATIIIQFHSGDATHERVCEALETGLSLQRSQA